MGGQDCDGKLLIEYPTGSHAETGVVVERFKCNCLESITSTDVFPRAIEFFDTFDMKYESPRRFGGAVANFFVQTLGIIPLQICVNHLEDGNEKVVLYFHSMAGCVPMLSLSWIVKQQEDKGWVLEDFNEAANEFQGKQCIECGYINVFETETRRLIIRLSCEKHCICEKCCWWYFRHPESRVVLAMRKGRLCCLQCTKVKVYSVELPFVFLKQLRAPRAYNYMGDKPIITENGKLLIPFFKANIKWVLLETKWAEEQYSRCALMLKAAKVELARYGRSGRTFVAPNPYKERVERLTRKYRALLILRTFLKSKREFVKCFVEWDVCFPNQFLNQDAGFYGTVLEKNRYDIMKTRVLVNQILGA